MRFWKIKNLTIANKISNAVSPKRIPSIPLIEIFLLTSSESLQLSDGRKLVMMGSKNTAEKSQYLQLSVTQPR
jgi:hypothetical protein